MIIASIHSKIESVPIRHDFYFLTHESVRYSCNCEGNRGSRFNRNIEEITCISSTYRFEMEFNLVSIYTVLSINERKTLCSVHTTMYHRFPISFRFQRSIFLFFQLVKKKESISIFQFWKISFPYSSIFVDRHSYRNSKMFKTREHYKFLYIERRVLLCIQYTRVIIVNVNEDVSLVLTFNFKLLSIGE